MTTTPETHSPESPFSELHLPDELLRAISEQGFTTPTPVQQQLLPLAREGFDLLVCAATGSGKTAAYLLPLLERFHDQPAHDTATRGLILAPTRELAQQIQQHFLELARFTRLTAAVITGGHPYRFQIADLRRNPDLLIATPGRLLEHLEGGNADLSDLEYLVLDEADRMLDMGFAPDVLQILEVTNPARQSLLLSATLNQRGLQPLTDKLLRDPRTITIDSHRERHPAIQQQRILADDAAHKQQLLLWLAQHQPYTKAIIFANTRDAVRELGGKLQAAGLRCGILHGELEQRERNRILGLLRSGTLSLLVATDVAARGLDISDLDLVINYDMPRNAEELLHRTGRTGRAGERGLAISLVTAPDWNRMISIERYLGLHFEALTIDGIEARFKGPKRCKSSGKAARSHKPSAPPKAEPKAPKKKIRERERKNIGKRRQPSNSTTAGDKPLTRKR